jgi:hypothetical protein
MSTRFYDTDLTDDLVGLLIETIHQIGARAERKVERELLDDLKRVTGKRQSNLDPFKLALVKTELEDRVDRRLFSRA